MKTGIAFKAIVRPSFFRNLILLIIIVTLVTIFLNSPIIHAQNVVYDAFNDFSATSNPTAGGLWRYGDTASLGGAFSAFPNETTLNGLAIWYSVGLSQNVLKNITGVDIDEPNDIIHFPATQYLHFHPGPDGQFTVVRFTAPSNGIYQVDSSFESLRTGGNPTTTDVHVLVNGASYFDANIYGYLQDGTKDFSQSFTLTAGGTIDFVVGVGTDGNFGYDSTGIKATITQQPLATPTPTPSQAIQKIVDTVKTFNLQQGILNSLDTKLQDASDALNAANSGNRQDAVNKLQAFMNEVQAQRGTKLTNLQADNLIAQAQAVINRLS